MERFRRVQIYRRECFESVRYPQGKVYEDIDTTYTILNAAKKVALIEDPLIMYRRRTDSITEKYSLSSARDRIRSYANIEKKVQDNSPEIFDQQHQQWIYRRRIKVFLDTYARCGKEAKCYKSDILELGKKVELARCDMQTKAFYSLFRISPRLFKVVYLTALYVKRGIQFLIGLFQLGGKNEL